MPKIKFDHSKKQTNLFEVTCMVSEYNKYMVDIDRMDYYLLNYIRIHRSKKRYK